MRLCGAFGVGFKEDLMRLERPVLMCLSAAWF